VALEPVIHNPQGEVAVKPENATVLSTASDLSIAAIMWAAESCYGNLNRSVPVTLNVTVKVSQDARAVAAAESFQQALTNAPIEGIAAGIRGLALKTEQTYEGDEWSVAFAEEDGTPVGEVWTVGSPGAGAEPPASTDQSQAAAIAEQDGPRALEGMIAEMAADTAGDIASVLVATDDPGEREDAIQLAGLWADGQDLLGPARIKFLPRLHLKVVPSLQTKIILTSVDGRVIATLTPGAE
jgi:hypothetical protein